LNSSDKKIFGVRQPASRRTPRRETDGYPRRLRRPAILSGALADTRVYRARKAPVLTKCPATRRRARSTPRLPRATQQAPAGWLVATRRLLNNGNREKSLAFAFGTLFGAIVHADLNLSEAAIAVSPAWGRRMPRLVGELRELVVATRPRGQSRSAMPRAR